MTTTKDSHDRRPTTHDDGAAREDEWMKRHLARAPERDEEWVRRALLLQGRR
ncbi:hypothetical protein [Streptomyces sp. NPDC059080]|uniref:hypothetical protein n=1 Tax=Streptomyces sp. NPDC059080 TaxID=3346718 RepID=UPI00369EE053